jgi:hypothetical protein
MFKSWRRDASRIAGLRRSSRPGGQAERMGDGGGLRKIEDQVLLWQTPQTDSFRSRGGDRKDEMGLDQQSRFWPTPDAQAMNDGEAPASWKARAAVLKVKHGNGNGAGMPLAIAGSAWGTPTSRDHKDGDCTTADVPTNGLLGRQAVRDMDSSRPDQQTARRGPRSFPSARTLRRLSAARNLSPGERTLLDCWTYRRWSLLSRLTLTRDEATGIVEVRERSVAPYVRPSLRKRLNPRFVESLMMWPERWTSVWTPLEPAAMESWLCRARQHLLNLFGGREFAETKPEFTVVPGSEKPDNGNTATAAERSDVPASDPLLTRHTEVTA